MPSIPELSHIGKVSCQRISARKRVMYPWLPAILNEDSLSAIATLGHAIEDQEEVFWFLTVVQNALSLEAVLYKSDDISSADLNRILPTMVRHINFMGRFDLDFTHQPPFELKQVIG